MLHFSMKIKSGLNTWGLGTFYGFLDQGLFSSTNFIISILLARWIPEEDYGAFAVAFSFYILFSTVHSALITEPMLVFGSTQHEDRLSEYISNQIGVHFLLVLILSLILAFWAMFTISTLQPAIIGAALAMPFTLLLWLFRRACYIRMQTQVALYLSLIYSITIFLGLLLFRRMSILSPISVFILMGLASVIASLPTLNIFKIRIEWKKLIHYLFFIDRNFLENFKFGKWLLVAYIADSISNLFYPPVISLFSDLSRAAVYRSMLNLVLPLQQIQSVISLILLPWLSKNIKKEGKNYIQRNIYIITGAYVLPAICYIFPISLFGNNLSNLLYNNEHYNKFTWLIPYLSFSFIISSISLAIGMSLKAMELSLPLLRSKIVSMACVLTLGIILIYLRGLQGVVLSIYLSLIMECIVLIISFIKVLRGKDSEKNSKK